MYRERASRVPGGFVWTSVSTGDAARVLPDGCMDLMWDGHTLVVAGPDTRAQLFRRDAGFVMTGLRFAPGHAPRVLGVAADALTDDRVALDAILSAARVREITDAVAAAADPGTALETVVLEAATAPDADTAVVDAIAALARAGHNSTEIAERVGFSTRQLQRRSSAAFGYGAKTLARVLRMQRALAIARRGIRPADTAARTGYADQSHLARDVKEFAGVPLGALLR